MPDAQERCQMIERIIGRQLITRAGERHVPVSQLNGVRLLVSALNVRLNYSPTIITSLF